MVIRFRAFVYPVLGVAMFLISGCMAGPLPQPNEIVSPQPIQGNSGSYMCPYTTDGVAAEWVDKAIGAKMGATIGSHVGSFLGGKLFERIPLVGGILGSAVGSKVGRELAISSAGGWESIKSTSDLSFNSLDNMAVYLYVNHSSHEHYQEVLAATSEIYTDLKQGYIPAIRNAPRKPVAAEGGSP